MYGKKYVRRRQSDHSVNINIEGKRLPNTRERVTSLFHNLPSPTPPHRPLPKAPQQPLNITEEVPVIPRLASIPHHNTGKPFKLPGILDYRPQLRGTQVTPSSARVRRHAEQDSRVAVLARRPRPVVPLVEIEVPLLGLAWYIRGGTAAVVVELYVEEIELFSSVNGPADDRGDIPYRDIINNIFVVPICSLSLATHALYFSPVPKFQLTGKRTLRRRRQIVLPSPRRIHQLPHPIPPNRHILHIRLKVEIKAINTGISKGPQGTRARLHRPKHGPDLRCAVPRGLRRRIATLGVGVAAEGEEDGFALGLARLWWRGC